MSLHFTYATRDRRYSAVASDATRCHIYVTVSVWIGWQAKKRAVNKAIYRKEPRGSLFLRSGV
jgi:hypothetical protein